MLTTSEMAAVNVPAFLGKLWALVENPACDDLICWDVTGKSFHVFDQGRFSKEILPLYFKHNNIASFIRQLNMYGFRKVVHIDQGLKVEKEDLEFQHPYFQKEQEHLLEHIKRKISPHMPTVKIEQPPTAVQLKKEEVNKVLNDVRAMKGKQDSMDGKIDNIKRENEVLWREVASLRQKHIKQQQIVNKLIQFLVHLVGGNRAMSGLKRKNIPLMIQDSLEGSSPSKIAKYGGSTSLSLPNSSEQQYTVQSPLDQHGNNSGLTIHDITDQLSPQSKTKKEERTVANPASELSLPEELTTLPSDIDVTKSMDLDEFLQMQGLVNSSSDISQLPDNTDLLSVANLSTSPASASTVSIPNDSLTTSLPIQKPKHPSLSRQSSVSEMNDHLENLQYDLDGLKDILSTGQYNLDSSLLLGLFNADSSLNYGSEVFGDLEDDETLKQRISGNEVVQYKTADDALPDLFDLAELSRNEEESQDTSDNFKSLNTPQVSAEDLD